MSVNIQQGLLNTANLTVPGLYVGVIPPQPTQLNGVPTNIVAFVGNATYGPVNTPVTVSDMASYIANFGPITSRNNGIAGGDLGAAVGIAVQNGANNIVCVRVVDTVSADGSTSLAAATAKFGISGGTYALLLTSKYGGSAGNSFTATVQSSQYPTSLKVVLSSGLAAPEVFDGITNATPAAFWAALGNAINAGNGALRGHSNYFLATIGTNTTAAIPTAGSVLTLSGGTDGTASLSAADYVGVDGLSGIRSGMYALRGTGANWATLVDLADMTTWAAQLAFGISERIYMVSASPVGDTITAAAARGTNGASGYGLKIMFGDWCLWNDTTNGVLRLLSPATFAAARGANQSVALSLLNQPIYGIVGSQFSQAGGTYANADILALINAGYDVITPPGQGPGNLPIWTCATGNNTNYNPAAQGDNYTTMTNYLVNTIAAVAGLGQFLGQLITPALLETERAVLDAFYQNLADNGLIGNSGGGIAFQNTVTSTPTQQQNGIVIISSQVVYLAVNREIAVQLQGGTTVTILPQSNGTGR